MEAVSRLRMPTLVPVMTSSWDTTVQVTASMWLSVYPLLYLPVREKV